MRIALLLLLSATPLLAQEPAQEIVPVGTRFIGDNRSKQYYEIDCPAVDTVDNRMYFRTESGAQAAGYRRATCGEEPVVVAPVTAIPAPPVSPSPRTDSTPVPRRQGFWFNGGIGYGSATCNDPVCDRWFDAPSGTLSIGGTVSQKVLLGAMSSGWVKEIYGVDWSWGSLVGLIRWYPSAPGRFFLQGGIGYGVVTASVGGFGSASESGVASLVGLGYDIRLGNNVSLTPYLNGFATGTESATWSVGQLGLSITTH